MLIGVVPDLALRRRTCYEPLVSTHPDTQGSGNYTVTATSHWDVAWSGLGQQGNIPVTLTQTTQLTEVELQAIGQR